MKIVNQALLKVAEEIAQKFGYIETDRRTEDLTKDKFWGTSFCAAKRYLRTNEVPTFESVRYSYPIFEDDVDESKPRPKIELRVRFENPRIDIRFPDGGFIGLEYKPDTHEFSEAQIFGEDGYWKLPYVKERIDQLINSL
jgi:hypothetical protein